MKTMPSSEQMHTRTTLPDTIAIDGPGASGKTTIAEMLADYLDYMYFDTGVMYRAVTFAAIRQFGAVEDEELVSRLAEEINIDVHPPSIDDGRKNDVLIDGLDETRELRTPTVNDAVSLVSSYSRVRIAMTDRQREIACSGSVVMVGRDIGTVVIPDADLKIYLDASLEERARRRYKEELAQGAHVVYEDILHSLEQRDLKDQSRSIAPLKPAENAYIIQTDHLSVEQVFEKIRQLLYYR